MTTRRRAPTRQRLGKAAERLLWLAQGLGVANSPIEAEWWREQALAHIETLLKKDDEEAINRALDRLYEADPDATPGGDAYDLLANLVESVCEGHTDERARSLLLAIPVLAWSGYAIPSGPLPAATLDALRSQLHGHVLARGARAAFANYLYSPDQMPQGFRGARLLADALRANAEKGEDLRVNTGYLPETQVFVSDMRFILVSVQAAPGEAVFRWQEPPAVAGESPARTKADAQAAWQAQVTPSLQGVLPGCVYEVLPPDAYFSAWRAADQRMPAFALRAAVAYLQYQLHIEATALRAVVAPYYGEGLEEWRIGFTRRDADDVLHGVIWPVADEEHAGGVDTPARIVTILREAGLEDIRVLDTPMPLDYCDDCGAPLFPNAEAENVHAEMPEEAGEAPRHLH